MNHPRIIGFSGKIASGKSTLSRMVAKHIAGDNYRVLSYATALKQEVQDIYTRVNSVNYDPSADPFWKGVPSNEIDHIVSLVKDDVAQGIIHTSTDRSPLSRHLVQRWGTSIRRNQDDQYWVKKFNQVVNCIDPAALIVVDDVRFTNEAENILTQGGQLVRINVDDKVRRNRLMARDGNTAAVMSSHASETELDNTRDLFDVWVDITKEEPHNVTLQRILEGLEK